MFASVLLEFCNIAETFSMAGVEETNNSDGPNRVLMEPWMECNIRVA